MKNTKANIGLAFIVIVAGVYIIKDAIQNKWDAVARHAAGESDFERFKKRK